MEGIPAMSVTWDEFVESNENVNSTVKTKGAVLALAPITASLPGTLTTDGVMINALPVDYVPLGMFTTDGITFDRDVSTEPVEALGHLSPVREDITGDVGGFTVNLLEVLNRAVIEAAEGVDLSSATVDAVTGEVSYDLGDAPGQIFYRAVLLGFDGSLTSPVIRGSIWPRVSVVSFPAESWNQTDAVSYEIGFRSYFDSDLGFKQRRIIAGKGFLTQAAALGWTTAP